MNRQQSLFKVKSLPAAAGFFAEDFSCLPYGSSGNVML
jgi:hypothetical protein